MNTFFTRLTGSLIQRFFVAVVITAGFLSAAFAAILPATEYSQFAASKAPQMTLPESIIDDQYAALTKSIILNASKPFNPVTNYEMPKPYDTVGTEHFTYSLYQQLDIQRWTRSTDTQTSTDAAVTQWSMSNISYPNIHIGARVSSARFKPMIAYRTIVSADSQTVVPIPAVRCMGLSSTAVAKRAERYEESIQKYAMQYGVSANLVKAIVTRESCFDPKARSHVGAIGLMQLMPETAQWLKVADPHNSQQNLRGGIKYLASLYKQFERIDLTLAAYNAGPGNVERYGGIPPFAETQKYVKSVLSHYRYYSATADLKVQLALK